MVIPNNEVTKAADNWCQSIIYQNMVVNSQFYALSYSQIEIEFGDHTWVLAVMLLCLKDAAFLIGMGISALQEF